MTMNGLKKFDVNDNGVIGYHETHADIYDDWINEALESVGSIIIREFTKIESHKTENNISVPYKNIYGFVCSDGIFRPLGVKELEESFSVDYATNKPLEIERGVRFCITKKW